MLFFLFERIVRSSGGGHSHGAHDHGGHSHEHEPKKKNKGHDHDHATSASSEGDDDHHCCDDGCGHDHGHAEHASHDHHHEHGYDEPAKGASKKASSLRKRRASSPARTSTKPKAAASSPAASKKAAALKAPSSAAAEDDDSSREHRVAGYLNLVADAAHNFTDGLLVGGAYSQSFAAGVATTLACLLHEVPHEVGDVAILLQSGFTMRRAVQAQLLTACSAMLGTIAALATGKTQANLLSNVTAGGFIYVATMDVLPPILKQPATMMQTACQLLAMACGIGMMVVVMYFE